MKKLALCFLFLLSNNLYAAVSDTDISKSAYCDATSFLDEYSDKPIFNVKKKHFFSLETAKQNERYCYKIKVPKGKDVSIQLLAKPGQYNFAIGKKGRAPKLYTDSKDDPNLCLVEADNFYIKDPFEHIEAFDCKQILMGQNNKKTIYYAAFQYIGGRANPDCRNRPSCDTPTKPVSEGNLLRATFNGESNFSQ